MYLDGVIERSKQLLAFLVDAMNATRTTDVQYRVQLTAPVILRHLDRAQAPKRSL